MAIDVSLLFAGFGFGIALKTADMIADDGLQLFPLDGHFFGALWGIFGLAIVYLDPNAACLYAALLIYWCVRGKIDHIAHLVGSTMLVLGILSRDWTGQFAEVVTIFTAYESAYHVKRVLRNRIFTTVTVRRFFDFKLQFLLVPLGYGLWIRDLTTFLIVLANMLGLVIAIRLWTRSRHTGVNYGKNN